MDSGISDMINGILSNPEALGKIMTMAPVITQMMNGGANTEDREKIVETMAVNKSAPPGRDISVDSLMANAGVAAALKNLILAINAASSASVPDSPRAASDGNDGADSADEKKPDAVPAGSIGADSASAIEKTIDTLKNFTSATSPETDNRLKLLLALKPFLKDGRKGKIDSAIKYMNAAKIINLFGKNGFV